MKKFVLLVSIFTLVNLENVSATLYVGPPDSIDVLIDQTTIIVKGTFGRKLSQGKFYGYDRDGVEAGLETFADTLKIPSHVASQMGFQAIDWEIDVEEVLYGDVPETLILRFMIEPLNAYFSDTQSAERLFFLTINPDGKTYGTASFGSILENVDGNYRYRGLQEVNDAPILETPPYAAQSDLKVEVFEAVLKERFREDR